MSLTPVSWHSTGLGESDVQPTRTELHWRLGLLLLGLAMLYLPTFADLARTVWASDEQGHGPIILSVSLWLIWRKRDQLLNLPSVHGGAGAWGLLAFALVVYLLGRTQAVLLFEVGSLSLLLTGLLLLFWGRPGLALMAFPLLFLLFMIPLPGALVATVTGPLKSGVSAVAEFLLFHAGYPVGRSGVVLSVGPYQLLVADACAGLSSLFTLEALGLLYLNLMQHSAPLRNLALAILIVPISFLANVVRVMILVLVTYHYGDAAGQGFVHSFAGMVLFIVGLFMMLAVDALLGRWLPAAKPVDGGLR
ncbi:exosortase B [Inhella inkyongensis]|uniref:Exosortase B n=1 Tax=Inhella inkyongensis TaxID=392593 RepID=A0A840S4H1_9BURK|nr:exosortase B [Inhella inkyongensis]MBB5204358.1 exosortase B [Inhella inkyongensis]